MQCRLDGLNDKRSNDKSPAPQPRSIQEDPGNTIRLKVLWNISHLLEKLLLE